MNAFAKPTSLKAALKLALYGPAGSGKTFTALLLSERLARQCGRRVAVLDTEQGTAFYSVARLTAIDLKRVRRLYGTRMAGLKAVPAAAAANGAP
jgi:hypothetical protein